MSSRYFGRILIVDDDPIIGRLYEATLAHAGFVVSTANDLRQMRDLVSQFSFTAVVLDLNLGEDYGMDGLPFLLKQAPFAKVFVLTSNASIERAVDAMQRGATGFLTKDLAPDKIVGEILKHLTPEKPASTAGDLAGLSSLGLTGESLAIKELIATIEKIRNVDSTVLILGESGTGKEVVARAIHNTSPRATQRFEAINCGAIPENLLESELFGHKKGSFTDAKADRKGIFEICSQGTLLLDEIGDMPISLQTKLLRVLQERHITPIGAGTSIPINTRVIAATHRDILDEAKSKRFREDLYYRLSVVVLHLPPLRHRSEDIPLLVRCFLEQFNKRFSRDVRYPTNLVMSRIMAYDWPGNVRELQNAIERAVVLATDDQLKLEHMFQHLQTRPMQGSSAAGVDSQVFSLPLTEAKQHFEKAYLENLLKVSGGNISEAARISGRYRADIYRLMNRYGFDQDQFR